LWICLCGGGGVVVVGVVVVVVVVVVVLFLIISSCIFNLSHCFKMIRVLTSPVLCHYAWDHDTDLLTELEFARARESDSKLNLDLDLDGDEGSDHKEREWGVKGRVAWQQARGGEAVRERFEMFQPSSDDAEHLNENDQLRNRVWNMVK
jgi:hypothetical protein